MPLPITAVIGKAFGAQNRHPDEISDTHATWGRAQRAVHHPRLDVLAAGALLVGCSLTCVCSSFVAREGRRIARQGRLVAFWAEVAGGHVLALILAVAGWIHWFTRWSAR